MDNERDNREPTTKPEPEDKTDYQAINSMGGPKVLGQAEADNEETPFAQKGERHTENILTSNTELSDELTEEGFRALCHEAMEDSRSIDPDALLFEILVRVRAKAGDPDPRGVIPVEYDLTSGETYWKGIDEIVKSQFRAIYDVKAILTDAIQENSELKER
jgi:hypothetical protein